MRYSYPNKAFTLIEIMLVIAMIGILAAGAFYMG
jgi:prepilin-type N-terminal cleavage/methylation domain-containing protein